MNNFNICIFLHAYNYKKNLESLASCVSFLEIVKQANKSAAVSTL